MNRHAKVTEVKDGYFLKISKTFTAKSKMEAVKLAEDQGIPRDKIEIKEASNNGDK